MVRRELAEAIAGLRPRTGTVHLKGRALAPECVAGAMRAGTAYLTEDRKGAGLLLEKSPRENLTLPLPGTFGWPLIARLAAKGRSLIVISSEMPEPIGLASRVIVMHAGRMAGALAGAAVTEQGIVRLAMGMEQTAKENAA